MKIVNQVTKEMEARTNEKFAAWDKAVAEDWLSSPDEKVREKAYKLLNDSTIFAYAFFKNKEGEPFKLYPYQDIIISDKNKRIIFAAANQIGKSITLCWKALHFALTNPGKTVLMVSKTMPQAKDLLMQIKQFLETSKMDYKGMIGSAENKTEIYFKHLGDKGQQLAQSRIICVPATEAALGYAVDLLLIDELAFYDDGHYFYFQIAQPRTYTTKGQIIVFSNPNGQQGIFWELWNDKDFSHYTFNFLDKPGNTKKEYEKLRETLTVDQFDSTVNSIFTNPSGGFLSLDERRRMQVERENSLPSIITQPLYIAFDWAKSMDRTVRIIGVPKKGKDTDWADEVYVYEMKEYPQGTPYDEIIDGDLKSLIHDVGPQNIAMVGWDNTGVGRGLEDFVKRVQDLGIMTTPIEFSLQNKSRIYTLLKLLVENNRITIPFISECDKQLASLRFKKTSNRNTLQVHHASERDRDDYPDAIAALCSLIINPETPEVSCTII